MERKLCFFDVFARFWECFSPNRIKDERFLLSLHLCISFQPSTVAEQIDQNLSTNVEKCEHFLWSFVFFYWFSHFLKSCGARSSGDVVRRLLGTLWEMLRDALAVGAKWFGKTFGRWFDGSFVRFIGSFVRWFVRSVARRKHYVRKLLRELAHNSR